jgi:DNA-binding NarL/FixJ family response regulator
MLTTFDQDEYVYEAFRAGASGFLLKSAPPRELAGAAIRTVASGDALLAPEITRRMIEDCVRRPHPGSGPPAALVLSKPTVKTHVTRMLTKLQLRDRVQAVVFAYECGLVQPGR